VALPHPNVRPADIVTGPDGDLWFTELAGFEFSVQPICNPDYDLCLIVAF
jgi:hypothetical protein